MVPRSALVVSLIALPGCAAQVSQMPPSSDVGKYVIGRLGVSGPGALQWRPDVCARADLHPDYRLLNETNLVASLKEQHFEARVERQAVEANKPELLFVFVSGGDLPQPVPLRVAVLPSADEAGHALSEALAQRGKGGWGVHRANLAVLGPMGREEDDLEFAAKVGLACWGTFTFAPSDDAFVVPGGYAEP